MLISLRRCSGKGFFDSYHRVKFLLSWPSGKLILLLAVLFSRRRNRLRSPPQPHLLDASNFVHCGEAWNDNIHVDINFRSSIQPNDTPVREAVCIAQDGSQDSLPFSRSPWRLHFLVTSSLRSIKLFFISVLLREIVAVLNAIQAPTMVTKVKGSVTCNHRIMARCE